MARGPSPPPSGEGPRIPPHHSKRFFHNREVEPDTMPHEPRYANGARRRALRNRLKAEGRPCWICVLAGKSGRIDYDLPHTHPYAFEVDELIPVSKYWLGGYPNAQAAALDYGNLAAAHRCCNEWRGNKTVEEVKRLIVKGRQAPRIIGEHHTSRDWRTFKPKGR